MAAGPRMSEPGRGPYLTEPRMEALPWLVHGFGTADWTEASAGAAPGFESFAWAVLDQVHGDAVHRIDRAPAGRLRGDGLVTTARRLLLVVRTADCLPVLLAGEPGRVVAAVHCGRRGTARRILARAVEIMVRDCGAEPGRIIAALGPCIGPACYEVGEEVRDEYLREGFPAELVPPRPESPGKYLLDLRRANAMVLAAAGVLPENVFHDAGCTHCGSVYFSYRRDPGEPGRMVNFIGLR